MMTLFRLTWVSLTGLFSILDFIGAEDDGDDGDSVRYRMCSSYGQIATTNKPTPSFLKAGCLSCRPTNSVKALFVSLNAGILYDRTEWTATGDTTPLLALKR